MKQHKLIGYLQAVFVIIYLVVGFALLTVPAFKEKLSDTQRFGLAFIFLLYSGYRGFNVYKKYFSNRNEEE